MEGFGRQRTVLVLEGGILAHLPIIAVPTLNLPQTKENNTSWTQGIIDLNL